MPAYNPFQLNSFHACNANNRTYPHCVTALLPVAVYGNQDALFVLSGLPLLAGPVQLKDADGELPNAGIVSEPIDIKLLYVVLSTNPRV